MIQLIRIDDRLVHGQVVYSWKASLGYQAIVVADDAAAKDEIRKKVIKMATPRDTKSIILSVEDTCKFLQNPKLNDVKIFVVVGSPKAAYEIAQCVGGKPPVNLGGMMAGEGRREFAKAVYLNDEDVSYLDKLVEGGISIETRQTPSERIQSFDSLRNSYK